MTKITKKISIWFQLAYQLLTRFLTGRDIQTAPGFGSSCSYRVWHPDIRFIGPACLLLEVEGYDSEKATGMAISLHCNSTSLCNLRLWINYWEPFPFCPGNTRGDNAQRLFPLPKRKITHTAAQILA